jgi:hypothetical protein
MPSCQSAIEHEQLELNATAHLRAICFARSKCCSQLKQMSITSVHYHIRIMDVDTQAPGVLVY